MGLLLMERFFFIARVPFSDLIVDTWVQNIPDSMTKTQSYFSHLGKPRTGVLPDIKLLTSKMRRNHRPEDITVYPLQEDGRPDMPLEALREIPSYSVPPRSTLGLLWVDLIHTIEFRDDAVEDIRMRGLEEPDNVEDFLALGYDVEQIEAVHLSGFSTRIEKVKVGNVYDAIVEEKPNICSPDSPWLIEIYSLSHNDDLHELERFGVEGGHCPTPCATHPECAWVVGARSEGVLKVLGRAGVEGAAWYGAVDDAIAIGVWNLRRHLDKARAELAEIDPRLSWDDDAKPVTLWMLFCAMSRWSAGGRGSRHIGRFAARLAPLDGNARVGEFMRAAAEVDDPGGRHKQDEYTALRSAQKLEAGRAACKLTDEDPAWFVDGLDGDREQVYAALVRAS